MVNLEQLRPFHGDFEYALNNFTLCDLNREELSYLAGALDYSKMHLVLGRVKYNNLKSIVSRSLDGGEEVGVIDAGCVDVTHFPTGMCGNKLAAFINRDNIYLIDVTQVDDPSRNGYNFVWISINMCSTSKSGTTKQSFGDRSTYTFEEEDREYYQNLTKKRFRYHKDTQDGWKKD